MKKVLKNIWLGRKGFLPLHSASEKGVVLRKVEGFGDDGNVIGRKRKRKNNSKKLLVIKNKVSTFALHFESGVFNKTIAKGVLSGSNPGC